MPSSSAMRAERQGDPGRQRRARGPADLRPGAGDAPRRHRGGTQGGLERQRAGRLDRRDINVTMKTRRSRVVPERRPCRPCDRQHAAVARLRDLALLPALIAADRRRRLVSPVFLTQANITTILTSSAALALVVLAESLIIITGKFDLSLESIVGFAPAIGAMAGAARGQLRLRHRAADRRSACSSCSLIGAR